MPSDYPPLIRDLLAEERLNPLGPGTANRIVLPRLEGLTIANAFAPQTIRDTDMATACLSGLWLYHDFLDQSHTISQDLETSEGSYWHALMHRREPDFWNSKYWFRRVGRHPMFEPLRTAAADLAAASPLPAADFLVSQATWDPFAFIDLCETVSRGETAGTMLCRQVQKREWQLLFDWCYRHAVGRG